MSNILALCFFPAFIPAKNGGEQRLFNFYNALSESHNVTLLTSTYPGAEEMIVQHGSNFKERRIPKDAWFVGEYQKLLLDSNGGDISGPALAASSCMPTSFHRAYLEEYLKADILIFDDPFTAKFDIFSGIDSKPRIYNSYNCESDLYSTFKKNSKTAAAFRIVIEAESDLLDRVDLVLYCSDLDLSSFRAMSPHAKFEALYVPNGANYIDLTNDAECKSDGEFHALFIGSNHPPNLKAAEFILKNLAPSFPSVIFDIVGGCLPDGEYPSNIRRHGIVNDDIKHSLFQLSDVALNPITEGSGSNVKVLEYMAHGIPVLSTKFGMRGISAESGQEFIESSQESFVGALGDAIKSPERLRAVGGAGKDLVESLHDWKKILQPIAFRISNLVSKSQKSRQQFVLALNDYNSFVNLGGGGVRTRGLYNAVTSWSKVVFLCFSEDNSLECKKHGEDIIVFSVPRSNEHLEHLAKVNSLSHILADDIVAGLYCERNHWLTLIYQVLRSSARVIVIEHCYMVCLPIAYGDRFVYSSQNNETKLKKTLLKWHPLGGELISDVARFESLAVERSAVSIAVSIEDAIDFTRGRSQSSPIMVVGNGAEFNRASSESETTSEKLLLEIGDRAVVFIGSAHIPNIDSAQFIINELAPQCKDVEFHIIGSVCDSLITRLNNVRLWGVVADSVKAKIMQSCKLALNPMLSGSGSNVKLADYLGNGLFVITTEFGRRGYPSIINDHVFIASLDGFKSAIYKAFERPKINEEIARRDRLSLFQVEFCMRGIAQKFLRILQNLEVKKKRILFVTYRFTSPPQGGAEAHIEKLLSALGNSGKFDIDVVAPSVSRMENVMRFHENYHGDTNMGALVDVPNIHFVRFPLSTPESNLIMSQLKRLWMTQGEFDRALSDELAHTYCDSGLTWGWGYPEIVSGKPMRWAFSRCGLFFAERSHLVIKGQSVGSTKIAMERNGIVIGDPWQIDGCFELSMEIDAGEVDFISSISQTYDDPRELGFWVTTLSINGQKYDLASPTLIERQLFAKPPSEKFSLLDRVSNATRVQLDTKLTSCRGPWSDEMDQYIANHTKYYDLIITNNIAFRPAMIAISEAKRFNVPSILIPHTHLDDDFYHFPDMLQCAKDATVVLAAPNIACDFFREKGCEALYSPSGYDDSEVFSNDDLKAFRDIYLSTKPFVLVLGRKAQVKGYEKIIYSIDHINAGGGDIRVVLIGPDDDGIRIKSPYATYLGYQSREVVRGALLACLCLCNMSTSESFGMVILEAWLAGKPVVLNKNCAAFQELAIHEENALLVDETDLPEAIKKLVSQVDFRERLGASGNAQVKNFNWDKVCNDFLSTCFNLIKIK